MEKEIIRRDLALFEMDNKFSWTSMVRRICALYSLPSPYDLIDHPPPPESWKDTVTKAINSYWELRIKTFTATYPSLRFMATQTLTIGKAHPAITTISSNPFDVYRSRVRLKILTGTYVLQSNRPAYNQSSTKTCLLCNSGVETREHFLLMCPSLETDRRPKLDELSAVFQGTFNTPFPALSSLEQLKVIIDPTLFLF